MRALVPWSIGGQAAVLLITALLHCQVTATVGATQNGASDRRSFTAPDKAQVTKPVLKWHDLLPVEKPSVRRHKRQWNIPIIRFLENEIGPFPKLLVTVESDKAAEINLRYSITGPGADLSPRGLFIINPVTGELSVTGPVDREKVSMFRLQGHATDLAGFKVEQPCDLKIHVLDQNDNFPEFNFSFSFAVKEGSQVGAVVGRIRATDLDDPATGNAQLAYRLIGQNPTSPGPNMFTLDEKTGTLTVAAAGLDREKIGEYSVILVATDNAGARFGHSSTATFRLSLLDINDNAPTFTSSSFSGSVMENRQDVTVMRIAVQDFDKRNSENWRAVYRIIQGNENGNFAVHTDPITNEGVVTVVKALDYEKASEMRLSVTVGNEVPLVQGQGPFGGSGGGGGGQRLAGAATVIVQVQNERENPVFSPSRLIVTQSEGNSVNSVVTTYTASAAEETNQPLRYRLGYDPAGWLRIDETKGTVYVKKTFDYENEYVVDGKYMATVLAVGSGQPAMTGTATLEIDLIDVNDHAPDLIRSQWLICLDSANGTVIKAKDEDGDANAGPFTFSLPSSKEWTLQTLSSDTAFLAYRKGKAPVRVHHVPVSITDRGGKTTTKILNVTVCKCDDQLNRCLKPLPTEAQIKDAGAMGLSGGALAAILLSLLLLPLLAFLMMLTYKFCCGGAGGAGGGKGWGAKLPVFSTVDGSGKGSLIQYHDEGAGETMATLPPNGFDTLKSQTSAGGLEKSKGLHQTNATTQLKSGAGETVSFGQQSAFTHNEIVSESRRSEMAGASGMVSSPGVVIRGPGGATEKIVTMGTTIPGAAANMTTEMFGVSSMDQAHGTFSRGSGSGQGGAGWSLVEGSRLEGAPTLVSPVYLSSPGPVTTLSRDGGLGHCVQRVEAPIAMSPTSTLRYQEVRGRSDLAQNAHLLVSEMKRVADADPQLAPSETLLVYEWEGNATPVDNLSLCSELLEDQRKLSKQPLGSSSPTQ
uniref:B-cadherin-like isoform X2 n=1 Tax=Myxine glutinosa TaxID=7769 RepID=UPI00358FAC6D